MKKILLFTITAIVLLSALTACSDKGNVSDNADGAITDASEAVDDMTDMIMPETTIEGRSRANNGSSNETESTERTSESGQDNARSRRSLPR